MVCWFLCKNLSSFVYPVWKLHDPYCHNWLSLVCNPLPSMIPLFYVTQWNTESADNERTSLLSVTKMPPLFLDNYLGSSWIKNLEKTCQIESDTKRPAIVSQVFCIPTYNLLLLLQLKFGDLMDISVKRKQKTWLRCKSYFRSIHINQIENLFHLIWRGPLLVTLQKVVTLSMDVSKDGRRTLLHFFILETKRDFD